MCVRERKKCGVCLFLSLLGRGCALRCVCGVCHTVVISTLSHTALRGFLHCGERQKNRKPLRKELDRLAHTRIHR